MFSNAHFFRSVQEIPGFFESFFGGLFLVKGLPLVFQIGFLVCIGFSVAGAWLAENRDSKFWLRLGQTSTFGALCFGSFLLFQPWDELFVNLRHSGNLRDYGLFSFNHLQMIEATVDFLPYFVVGLLGKLDFPLVETIFLICLLGGWLCLLAGRRLMLGFGFTRAKQWAYPLLLLYPPLLLNCSHGFTVTLFSAALLWSVVFIFLDENLLAGTLCLALLPLIRIEGAWWNVLFLGYLCIRPLKRQNKFPFWLSIFVSFFPIACLSLWRWHTFGSPIPLPVQYKSALGNLFFLFMGVRGLLADLIASYSLLALFLLGTMLLGAPRYRPSEKARSGLLILGLLGLYCLPYYLSGGDWFPAAWGRYLFPFSFFSVVLMMSWMGALSPQTGELPSLRFWGMALAISLPYWFMPFASAQRVVEDIFHQRGILARLTTGREGRGNYRIENLSQLGTHLSNTTEVTDVVASSEVATVMYFAKREALDLLGIANSEIVKEPLRPTPDLFRHFPRKTELPPLIFKRLQKGLVEKYRPAILYTFDFFTEELLEGVPPEEITPEKIQLAMARWERKFRGLNGPLYGGIEKILALGYTPVVIGYGGDFFSLYFVSAEAKQRHFDKLKTSGLEEIALTNIHL